MNQKGACMKKRNDESIKINKKELFEKMKACADILEDIIYDGIRNTCSSPDTAQYRLRCRGSGMSAIYSLQDLIKRGVK